MQPHLADWPLVQVLHRLLPGVADGPAVCCMVPQVRRPCAHHRVSMQRHLQGTNQDLSDLLVAGQSLA